MKHDTNIPRSRRIWRWLGYGALGVAGVAALAAAGGAWWLWGWRVGSLSFHESWSPEQRAELQEMADGIMNLPDNVYKNIDVVGAFTDTPGTKLGLEIEMRPLLVQSYAELRRTAADGKAPEHEPIGIPMTALAARLGKLALARELVTRGDDPNNILRTDSLLGTEMLHESSFQTAIACVPLWISDEPAPPLPVAERTALLEHMLAHGATLTVPQPEGGLDARYVTCLIAFLSALNGDEGAMLEWLLDKGFAPLSPEERKQISRLLSMSEGSLPTVRRIVEKYYGELSDIDRYHLMHNSISYKADTPQKLRWALTELYADPNATLTESDENGVLYTMPSGMQHFCITLLVEMKHISTEEESESPTPDQVLEMLDLLLTHGAKLPDPEQYLPSDKTLHQKYMHVINKHHFPLPKP